MVGENILDVFLAVPTVVGENILEVFLAVPTVVEENISLIRLGLKGFLHLLIGRAMGLHPDLWRRFLFSKILPEAEKVNIL